MCTSFDEFPKAGIGIYLFFQNIKNLTILFFLLICFYCSYTLHINLNESTPSPTPTNYVKKMSMASTLQNLNTNSSLNDALLIQGWLIVGGVCLWWLVLFLMKRKTIQQEKMVDDATITAADFAIIMEHIPANTTQEYLQNELDRYYEELKDHVEIHGQ
jgi:hypothetical protein